MSYMFSKSNLCMYFRFLADFFGGWVALWINYAIFFQVVLLPMGTCVFCF